MNRILVTIFVVLHTLNPSVRVRRWLYRVGLAAVGLVVAYGIVAEQHALLWVALLGALLGMADANASD